MNIFARIRGLGSAVPETVVTNKDLEARVDTTDEWIVTRTGITERHVVTTERTSDLGTLAAKRALNDAGLNAEDITHILVATCTPDAYCPNTACLIEHKLGIKGRMALDVNAGCSGFVYGLELVKGILAADAKAVVLLVAAELLSHRSNWEDRTTCVLFGDGAGAVVFTRPEAGPGLADLEDLTLHSDGELGDLLTMKGGGTGHPYKLGDTVGPEHFIQMQGREVFKHAVRNMAHTCEALLKKNNLSVNDIDIFIPHQANLRIIETVGKMMNIDMKKVFSNVHAYGNTSAASIPIAMDEARQKGLIKPNTRMLLATFGGGFTWGAALFKTLPK